MDRHPFSDKRLIALAGIAAVFTAALALHGRVPQSQAYYQFAAQCPFFGIPNFFDVISNLPFLLVGIYGLLLFRNSTPPGSLDSLRFAYLTFFVGASLVALGSGYFHLNPNDSTLVWDRLPMTISFMSFVTIIVGEYISEPAARKLLVPLLLLGIFSVVWWRLTDNNDGGDLRIYILVQFLPMLLIPLIVWLYPPKFVPSFYVWGLLGMYGYAKLLELLDKPIFQMLKVISGHTLKHIAAALGVLIFAIGLVRRRRGAA
ncbi:ceramidase [Desulfoferrobacter suflitae]|uniref:ceramidase n=1 Tax=Desulfoferrobacter suflitae TaxID=2865782 RepID=UPI002164CB0F|nr:ceramidase [Desulfoferrobacter suflitae]MCK8603423.1 ceramidase [Desulfoferrobacter suflitae]